MIRLPPLDPTPCPSPKSGYDRLAVDTSATKDDDMVIVMWDFDPPHSKKLPSMTFRRKDMMDIEITFESRGRITTLAPPEALFRSPEASRNATRDGCAVTGPSLRSLEEPLGPMDMEFVDRKVVFSLWSHKKGKANRTPNVEGYAAAHDKRNSKGDGVFPGDYRFGFLLRT
ncbi:hypothetical protein JB92DRAFT_2835166 [Gautieria morchelliformis]|nr:hypothetical protein JB92DRAFT_2835166 [Gautieria morchelliformis]